MSLAPQDQTFHIASEFCFKIFLKIVFWQFTIKNQFVGLFLLVSLLGKNSF